MQPEEKCLICANIISESESPYEFECNKCGLSGKIHEVCLMGKPPFPSGGLVFVDNVCPRCREKASKPVPGVEEALIDEIIGWLDVMEEVDYSDLPVGEKLSSIEWKCASERLSEIGSQLNDEGGIELMQKAYNRVHYKSQRRGSYLDRAWNGIGQWQA